MPLEEVEQHHGGENSVRAVQGLGMLDFDAVAHRVACLHAERSLAGFAGLLLRKRDPFQRIGTTVEVLGIADGSVRVTECRRHPFAAMLVSKQGAR